MNTLKTSLKIWGYVLVILGVVVMSTAMAAEGVQEAPGQPAEMDAVSVTGTVEVGDSGLIIKAADEDYFVMGRDLTAMLGKTVTATGTLSEGIDGKTIKVMTVKEVSKE